MRRSLALVAALALVALAPATASAQLPSPKSTTIVPGKSIAGVEIGMSVKRALAIWGAGSTCTEASVLTACYWSGTDRQGTASFNVGKTGKVVSLNIAAGRKGNDLVYAGPLQKWKTRKKVRLGSTVQAVIKAYPKVHNTGSGPQLGTGSRSTTFQISSTRTKTLIYQINVGPI